MKKHLFLSGSDSNRLSALLRSVLGSRMSYAGGFITDRITDPEDPDSFEYYLFPACRAAGIEGIEGESFFHFSWSSTDADTETFRNLGKRLIEEALYYPYAMLDHFGGFDLLIPEYRYALAELLSSEIPVIGVILSPDEVMEFKNYYGLGDKLDLYLQTLRTSLKKDIDTEIIMTDSLSEADLRTMLNRWSDFYAQMP